MLSLLQSQGISTRHLYIATWVAKRLSAAGNLHARLASVQISATPAKSQRLSVSRLHWTYCHATAATPY